MSTKENMEWFKRTYPVAYQKSLSHQRAHSMNEIEKIDWAALIKNCPDEILMQEFLRRMGKAHITELEALERET